MTKRQYLALGLMSGSSLDGLDVALCSFDCQIDRSGSVPTCSVQDWGIMQAETYGYSSTWVERLRSLPQASAREYWETHVQLGRLWLGFLEHFLATTPFRPELIASHGHTVFHDPVAGYSAQIGDAALLANRLQIPVFADFRAADIALGGQGAPLAPTADRYLFHGYDYFLNLGGIANLSAVDGTTWHAFDVAPANQLLDYLARQAGKAYDEDGQLAASGRLLPELLERLAADPYYQQPFPKSLDNSWIRSTVLPVLEQSDTRIADRLHTVCRFIAREIRRSLEVLQAGSPQPGWRLLATGGGVFNTFLMECLAEECSSLDHFVIEQPHPTRILFKEAALMALLGVLAREGIPNCMHTVTGATRDVIGGVWHQV